MEIRGFKISEPQTLIGSPCYSPVLVLPVNDFEPIASNV
jgi:hypothetical protein